MVVCSHCYHENPDEAVQCETCSAPLPTKIVCLGCGSTVLSDANFCGQCGIKLNAENSLNSEPLPLSSDPLSGRLGNFDAVNDGIAGGGIANGEAGDEGGLDALLGIGSSEGGNSDASALDESLEMVVAKGDEGVITENSLAGDNFAKGDFAENNIESPIDADTETLSPITEPLSEAEAQWLAEDDDDDLDDLELSWEAPPGPPPGVNETFENIEMTKAVEASDEVETLAEEGTVPVNVTSSGVAVGEEEDIPSPVTDLGAVDAIAAVLGTPKNSDNRKLEGMPGGMPPTEADQEMPLADTGVGNDLGDPWNDLPNGRPAPQAVEPPEGSEAPIVETSTDAEDAPDQEPEAATVLQTHEKGQLLHLQTNTPLPLPRELKVVHIGKTNSRVPPDIDMTDFPHAEIVSRIHADLHWDCSSYYLEDTGSANGTYVNSWPLPSYRRYQLRNGDRITLGKHDLISFIFQIMS